MKIEWQQSEQGQGGIQWDIWMAWGRKAKCELCWLALDRTGHGAEWLMPKAEGAERGSKAYLTARPSTTPTGPGSPCQLPSLGTGQLKLLLLCPAAVADKDPGMAWGFARIVSREGQN